MEKGIPLESTITKGIHKWLKDRGYLVFKLSGGAFQAAGLPDLMVIQKGGKVMFFEVKRPKLGKVSALQKKTLDLLKSFGIVAEVVYSLDDVKKIIGVS